MVKVINSIDVSCCKECPHYEFSERDGFYVWYTWRTCRKVRMEIDNIYSIPDWCPFRKKEKQKKKRKKKK
jgi:hypothetical protein